MPRTLLKSVTMATRRQKTIGVIAGGSISTAAASVACFYFIPDLLLTIYWLPLSALLPGAFIGLRLAKRFGSKPNTVLYSLHHRGRLVYIGISYSRRIGTRIEEHRKSGKKFSKVRFSKPYPRREALRIEARKIRRRRPKYNVRLK